MKVNNTVSDNQIFLALNQKVYTKDSILKTCYIFIDRLYIYLDNPKKNEILVSLKGKKNLTQEELTALKGDFLNELLNVIVRKEISSKNQKILEYIVGGAITVALEKSGVVREQEDPQMKKIEEEVEALKKELEAEVEEPYKRDSAGIKKVYEKSE